MSGEIHINASEVIIPSCGQLNTDGRGFKDGEGYNKITINNNNNKPYS